MSNAAERKNDSVNGRLIEAARRQVADPAPKRPWPAANGENGQIRGPTGAARGRDGRH